MSIQALHSDRGRILVSRATAPLQRPRRVNFCVRPREVCTMSGGYIQCGDFMGGDKSGSAISGVFDALAEFVPAETRGEFSSEIVGPLRASLEGGEELILIEPAVAEQLIPALESFSARVGQELGFPEPWEAPDKDTGAGLSPVEAKWGKGKGWQYYCATDLLQACRVSVKCGEPVCVSFD
jgi:hypothetical protein